MLMATLEDYKPSGILVTMAVMIIIVIGMAMYLATDVPEETEEFIGTVERLHVDTRSGGAKRFLVVRVATGESVSIPVDKDIEVREGAEVRLSRGLAGGGRLVYDFVGYLSDP